MQFEGVSLSLQATTFEPHTVTWSGNFKSWAFFFGRLSVGILVLAIALFLWGMLIYRPYAISWVKRSSDTTELDTTMFYASFSLLVLLGNQVMYFTCAAIASRLRLVSADAREAAYVILYSAACFTNVMLDLTITSVVSNRVIQGDNDHADIVASMYRELQTPQDFFDFYPLQKVLGQSLAAYCFPSCFLMPFVAEPVFAVMLPRHLAALLVRSEPTVRGLLAEKCLSIFTPMDLGRYADVLLNVTLTVLSFLFPCGLYIRTLLLFILCHTYIYSYDRYRVLRAVPSFHYSTELVDKCVNHIMIIPCGILASSLAWWTSQDGSRHDWHAMAIRCLGAFALHALVHGACLVLVVPRLGREPHKKTPVYYEEVAKFTSCSWFSANPVHCLRSQYFYGHNPFCRYCMGGREHLLRANPDLGVYFEKAAANAENY